MALIVTARHAGVSVGTSSLYVASSAKPSANSLLLVFDGAQGVNTIVSQVHATPTGGGWTYTQLGTSPTQANWAGDPQYPSTGAIWQASVGASPAAHTITVDAFTGTETAIYAPIACDVTDYKPSGTIVQYAQKAADTQPGGGAGNSSASGTVTLDATPTAGNVVIVYFFVAADSLGGISSPTMGSGKTFTSLTQQGSGTVQSGLWYRLADGSESTTITSADLGQLVGNYYAAAIEIAAIPNYTKAMWFTA